MRLLRRLFPRRETPLRPHYWVPEPGEGWKPYEICPAPYDRTVEYRHPLWAKSAFLRRRDFAPAMNVAHLWWREP